MAAVPMRLARPSGLSSSVDERALQTGQGEAAIAARRGYRAGALAGVLESTVIG
jgi:hypothetical protein